MKTSLNAATLKPVRAKLKSANTKFAKAFPGIGGERQPVHTVYGGAHLFSAPLASKMSETAIRTLDTFAPNSKTLMDALGLSNDNPTLWKNVYARVKEKLTREAVEDFRIDYEDGYGSRPGKEEDGHAESGALEVAKGIAEASLPPFIGIRIKPLSEECADRSLRTLDIFLSTLLDRTRGKLPQNFVVTLPKITIAEQSATLTRCLEAIEKKNRLKTGTIKFEIMVEMPQAIFDEKGSSPLRSFVDAGKGRCISAHFGTYDYTAGCQITASHQAMDNPVCDFAKHVMQVSLSGLPLTLSDGATNIMPIGPHRGTDLSDKQKSENAMVVHRAWRLSYGHIRHSLISGFYQGWDLHPAQIPIRYAAVYAFFLEGLEAAALRLKSFMDKAAKATLVGDVFDDAATGQGLLNFFLRGISCGAITEAEAEATGLTMNEIRSRSFLKILEGRKKM